MKDSSGHDMGQTTGIGLIIYGGTREQLQTKLRDRDDRITRLETEARSHDLSSRAAALSTLVDVVRSIEDELREQANGSQDGYLLDVADRLRDAVKHFSS